MRTEGKFSILELVADDPSTFEGILQNQGLQARALYDYQAGKNID